MDSVQNGDVVLAEILGYFAVCFDHVIFDKHLGCTLCLFDDVGRLSVFIQNESELA